MSLQEPLSPRFASEIGKWVSKIVRLHIESLNLGCRSQKFERI